MPAIQFTKAHKGEKMQGKIKSKRRTREKKKKARPGYMRGKERALASIDYESQSINKRESHEAIMIFQKPRYLFYIIQIDRQQITNIIQAHGKNVFTDVELFSSNNTGMAEFSKP